MGTDVFLLTKLAGSNSIQRACSQATDSRTPPRWSDFSFACAQKYTARRQPNISTVGPNFCASRFLLILTASENVQLVFLNRLLGRDEKKSHVQYLDL
jgi:hypothetical protein